MADLESLADRLAETTANLQAYIEARVDKIAGPLITAVQRRSAEEAEEIATVRGSKWANEAIAKESA